jgi:amino acid transporter
MLLFAVGFTTMSRYLPKSGAFYAYVTAGLGRVVGLGAAFLAVFAYLLLGFSNFPFFGINASALVSETFGGPVIDWFWYTLAGGIGCGILSYFKIDLSAKVLAVAMILEVMIVLVFDVAVFWNGGPEGRSLQPLTLTAFGSGAIGISVLFAATCFFGFEATAIFRDEVKQPNKTIPRATYIAVIAIGLFYAISGWMIITAYGVGGASQIAQKNLPAMFSDAMHHYVGKAGVDVVRVLLVTSLFAGGLSGQNILSRYLFNLGIDGVLPHFLGHAHPRHHSPYIAAIFVSGLWLTMWTIFVWIGVDGVKLYSRVAGLGGFAVLVLMLFTSIAVVAFFRSAGHINDSTKWHTLVAPVLALAALAVAVYLSIRNFSLLIDGSVRDAVILQGLTWGVFMAGMALAVIYRIARPDTYHRIGHQSA